MIAFLLFGRCPLIENHLSLTKWTFILITRKCWDWFQSSEFHPIYLWFGYLWMGFSMMTVGGSEYNGGDFQGTVLRRILKLSLGSVREWLMSSLGPNITGPCPSILLWICTFLVLRHLICFFLFPFSLFLKVQSTEWIVHRGKVRLESLWAWFWFKGVLPWGKRSERGSRRQLQPNSALTGRYHLRTLPYMFELADTPPWAGEVGRMEEIHGLKEHGDFAAPAQFLSGSNRFGRRCSALKSSCLAAVLHFFSGFGVVTTAGEFGARTAGELRALVRPKDRWH